MGQILGSISPSRKRKRRKHHNCCDCPNAWAGTVPSQPLDFEGLILESPTIWGLLMLRMFRFPIRGSSLEGSESRKGPESQGIGLYSSVSVLGCRVTGLQS